VRASARLSPSLLQRAQRLQVERLSGLTARLASGLESNAAAHERALVRVSSRLAPRVLERRRQVEADQLASVAARLQPCIDRSLARTAERLTSLGKLYAAVNPELPLERGFALVQRADRSVVRSGGSLVSGEVVDLTFADKVTRQAVVDGTGPTAKPKQTRAPAKSAPAAQGDLF
jgi:exodeoxyribonuclease VII large subunit